MAVSRFKGRGQRTLVYNDTGLLNANDFLSLVTGYLREIRERVRAGLHKSALTIKKSG